MKIRDFQRIIEEIYFDKDSQRGIDGTFRWFSEEVGELARAIRRQESQKLREEFADVFAWLVSLASLCEIDIQESINKYQAGCPKCKKTPCLCPIL